MNDQGGILRAEDIVTGYGNLQVINGISVLVEEGKINVIIGPNGAGKTTLLRSMLGYLDIWEGKVEYQGKDVTGQAPHTFVKEGISYVPQGKLLFPSMTVQDHLEMGAWTMEDEEAEKRIEEVFEMFPRLKERTDQVANTLSGGERQMVAVARAVLIDPTLILLDEPSLGLQPSLVDEVFEKVEELNSQGISILLVEQSAPKALDISDKAYVMDGGNIKFQGEGEELLEKEELRKLYLK